MYGESIVSQTKPELYEDFITLRGLELGKVYKVSVVAVDGMFSTESDVEEIDTHITGVVSILALCSLKMETKSIHGLLSSVLLLFSLIIFFLKKVLY